MARGYDLEDIVEAANYIEDMRKINTDSVFRRNGRILTWDERGTSIQIAYEMYGRYDIEAPGIDLIQFIEDELTRDLVKMKDVVTDTLAIPRYLDEGRVIAEQTKRCIKQAQMGSTGRQIMSYLKNVQEKMDSDRYKD